jgi:uracil-DNA glycosylase
MRVSQHVSCEDFLCADAKHECCIIPDVDVNPEKIAIIMISEAAPENSRDYFYGGEDALFQQTTILAFQSAGVNVSSMQDVLDMGVYATTAVKCGKTGYGIGTSTVGECSLLLDRELALFPNVKVYMLMGDVAIKAVNAIARRSGEGRVIPAGSTYKPREQEYFFRGKRAFPSYLQAGPSFFIEKSKQRMIAEDIREAMDLL